MKRQYMSCLLLSLIFLAPSLCSESGGDDDILTLYNNTIYPVTAEVIFGTADKLGGSSHSLAPGTAIRIKFMQRWQRYSIKATVPARGESVISAGKVVDQKITRQEKSVVFSSSTSSSSSAAFVINANRQHRHFINGIEQVQNLAIYRFIQ